MLSSEQFPFSSRKKIFFSLFPKKKLLKERIFLRCSFASYMHAFEEYKNGAEFPKWSIFCVFFGSARWWLMEDIFRGCHKLCSRRLPYRDVFTCRTAYVCYRNFHYLNYDEDGTNLCDDVDSPSHISMSLLFTVENIQRDWVPHHHPTCSESGAAKINPDKWHSSRQFFTFYFSPLILSPPPILARRPHLTYVLASPHSLIINFIFMFMHFDDLWKGIATVESGVRLEIMLP